jgi:hypothetical protein
LLKSFITEIAMRPPRGTLVRSSTCLIIESWTALHLEIHRPYWRRAAGPTFSSSTARAASGRIFAMFDAYHKWLGIPPKDQPPNHYRLLGLELFETDPEVIDAAANRQMSYLQKCAIGPNVALSQKLLSEIAAARICLLNADKRTIYDAELRAELGLADENAADATTDAVPRPAGGLRQAWERLSPRQRGAAGAGGAAFALLCVVLAIALSGQRPEVENRAPRIELAENSSPPAADELQSPIEATPHPAATPNTEPVRPQAPSVDPEKNTAPPVTPQVPEAAVGSAIKKASAVPEPPQVAATTPMPEPPAPVKIVSRTPEPAPPPAPVEPAIGKLPIPDEAALEQADAAVAEQFRKEFDHAQGKFGTLEEKAKLANQLLEQARQTSNEPATRFVLFRQAGEFAAKSGKLAAVQNCLSELEQSFQVDSLRLKSDLLDMLGRSAKYSPDRSAAGSEAFKLVDEALARSDVVLARALIETASNCAKLAKNGELSQAILEWKKEHPELKDFDEYRQAELDLKKDPANRDALLRQGRFLCLVQNEWDAGLPKLIQAGPPAIQRAAELESAKPSDPEEQVALGDAWWLAAEGAEGRWQERMRARAGYWYRRAGPRLPSAAQLKVEVRLGQLHLLGDSALLAKVTAPAAESQPEKPIYRLQSRRPVLVWKTSLQFQTRGTEDQSETQGTIALSTDGKHWIPAGGWTKASCLAASQQNHWYDLPLKNLSPQLCTREIQIRFDPASGARPLDIEQVVWLP